MENYSLSLDGVKKIYFIGIGGIGMSAAAGIAKAAGYEVSGSDSKQIYDPAKTALDNSAIEYYIGYDAVRIAPENFDLLIASSGEGENNPEVAAALEQGIVLHSFSELLYKLAEDKIRIVVAGTHGKSTTSGMLGKIVQAIDDSSFMTGAVLQKDNTNFYVGSGHYFVFEGDEYKALFDDPTPKFLQYKADIAILTNLEYDHPDLFENFEAMQDEFAEFIANMPSDGLIVYNSDSAALNTLLHQTNTATISFGIHHEADFTASELSNTSFGTEFKVNYKKKSLGDSETFRINLFGEMNVYNALGAIALMKTLGFESDDIQDGLDSYLGVRRRFEFLGESAGGVKVFDDYAHHPTAVSQTLMAARSRFPNSKIWAVFEPHTFSRTAATLEDLAKSFEPANDVLISEIYPARERAQDFSIKSSEVVAKISAHHNSARLVKDKSEALKILSKEAKSSDVIVIMAVGSFNKLGQELLTS